MITAESIKDYPSLNNTGLTLRKQKKGPELDFLYEYLHWSLPAAPAGQKLTIFIEPNVESVFPDAVAVYWDVATGERWNPNRRLLAMKDVRVLHYLALTRTEHLPTLEKYYSPEVIESLERLEAANLIIRKPRTWQIRSLKEIFAVKKLITIEAKIGDWQHGLLQAFFHTWFASESYLLLSKLPKHSRLVDEASRLGIGLVTSNENLENSLAVAKRDRIPKSYASWLFNEWAWRANYHEKAPYGNRP